MSVAQSSILSSLAVAVIDDVNASIASKSTACVTVICHNFVFSAEVANFFVAHSVISSVSSTDFINAQAIATLVASVTSANASIPDNLVASLAVYHWYPPAYDTASVQLVVIGLHDTDNPVGTLIATEVTDQLHPPQPYVLLLLSVNTHV